MLVGSSVGRILAVRYLNWLHSCAETIVFPLQERDSLLDRPFLDLLFDLSDAHFGRYFWSPVPNETHSSELPPPFSEGGCQFWLVNYGGEFCRGCASTKRYGYCGLADMDAGASPNQHKNQLYFNTRRLYRCHAFGNHCKTHWKSMVLNLACVLVTWPIVVFSCCNMLHILPCTLKMLFRYVLASKPLLVRMSLCRLRSKRRLVTKQRCA